MSDTSVAIRPGRLDDAEAVAALLEPYIARQIVLPRSAADIRRHIANFLVAERDGEVIGAVAVRDFGGGLEEIRSLVVREAAAGAGLGSRLVAAAVELARQRGATRVFALTLRPGLFERQHFLPVDKSLFPQKVWSDCILCPKRYRCDEIAVLLDLTP
ncbi:MAG: GNAT family N-acetyltransferase [Lentisphaeria bacterium]|nr:GNAT family N-acetyltransferase [Lentisphaeria bacterium]